jgi:hypothetical protein
MEGMTQCGQCLLCTYQFGIAGIIVLELALALILMLWATNQMEIISNMQGGDTSEGSLAHTINYNLGNNFVNCSYEDCCPTVFIDNGDTSFTEYEEAPGIFTYNESWPRATCVHPGDECTEAEEEQGLCEEELAPAPAPSSSGNNCSNCTNATNAPSPSTAVAEAGAEQPNEGTGDDANAVGGAPSAVTLPDDIVPLLPADYNGRQQMCMMFGKVQTVENCWDLGLYDTKLREYFWALLKPLSTVILVVVAFEFVGFVGAWCSLLWCCGAGSMKLDTEDSDDDDHEWGEEEHDGEVPEHHLHAV